MTPEQIETLTPAQIDNLRRLAEQAKAEQTPVFHDALTPDVVLALLDAVEQRRHDLVAHMKRQRVFSERTFGPGQRTQGVLDHIRKELAEIEQHPSDLSEWIDVVLLALDGAWRHGHEPQAIAEALAAKQAKNEARQWPDWRTAPKDRAIEHVKSVASRRGGDQ